MVYSPKRIYNITGDSLDILQMGSKKFSGGNTTVPPKMWDFFRNFFNIGIIYGRGRKNIKNFLG